MCFRRLNHDIIVHHGTYYNDVLECQSVSPINTFSLFCLFVGVLVIVIVDVVVVDVVVARDK